MASNKFAGFLHRNKTPKIAIILIYTLLEWTLIALLLLNGLFTYLISLFANFFALKPPCLLCSRVDHLFAPRKPIAHLLCDAHALEISKLGFCSRHGNLAEASDMCEDCGAFEMADRTADVVSWMRRSEGGERDLKCSCCGVVLESGFYSPYWVFKPSSFGGLEYAHKEELGCEEIGGVENCDGCLKDASAEAFCLMGGDQNGLVEVEERLVPLELIDSSNLIENSKLSSLVMDRDHEDGEDDRRDYDGYKLVEKDDAAVDVGIISEEEEEEEEEKMALLSTMEINKSQTVAAVDVVEEEYSSSELHCVDPQPIIAVSAEGIDAQVVEEPEPENYGEFQASEEDSKLVDVEANCEISIGSEICDHEQIDLPQFNEQCSASYNVVVDKEQVTEAEPLKENVAGGLKGLFILPEQNEIEEDKLPETPSSVDSFHALHKRLLIGRRESGAESLDGSVASEFDGSENLSVDNLKAALQAERKALSALYAELEEERSASAIAANQTMAMITRLQEEKAAMQMEAFQYQRMMEEQSEYDQEALQLLNELMMKREKEKQELEKELEVYRKKMLVYEAKDRKKAAKQSKINGNRSGTSSASSSASDSDDLSFESHEGEEFNHRHDESNQNTPADQEATMHKLTLDESLDDFEEERLSILEQLKALEEKLFSGDDFDNNSNENGHELNGFEDDLDTNGKLHHKRRSVTSGGKRLLPLFDATIDVESEDGSPQSVSKPAFNDHSKLAIVEEVDNAYERLQALEADREFLKHCVRSLKKGDKGMDLLQEILQHLRDLRSVELRVRNTSDGLAS